MRSGLSLSASGLLALGAICAALAFGCGDADTAGKKESEKGQPAMSITVTSSAFAEGQPMPRKYTADGQDVSPPLSWSGLPEKTKELALIMDDPDAPRPEPWVHWVIYKIPVTVKSLDEAIPRQERLAEPAGALQGKNSRPSGNIGYRGPSPPSGTHHYEFKLYALGAQLDVKPGLTKDELLKAMESRVLATGKLVGTYKR